MIKFTSKSVRINNYVKYCENNHFIKYKIIIIKFKTYIIILIHSFNQIFQKDLRF